MLTSALLAGACSASAPKLTDAGNEAFTQEAYDEALQAYQEAQVKSPELAEPYYNAANALYQFDGVQRTTLPMELPKKGRVVVKAENGSE